MDRDFKTLGIIVRKENTGERNSRLTLLTPDMGLMPVTAFGAGRGAGSARAPLYGEGVFSLERKNGNTVYLKDTQIISTHDSVSSSIDTIGWVSLFSELIIKSRTADSRIYRLYTSVLDNADDDNINKCAVYFLTHFLLLEGMSGDWETCPACGKRYEEGEILGFNTIAAGASCSSCDTLSSSLILPPNARRYVMKVSRVDIEEALGYSIRQDFVRRISRYLLRSLEYVFPAKLMTIESGLIS